MENNNILPHRDIAFVMYYPFHWYVYKNVYKHLKDRSEFIIDTHCFNENDGIKTLESMVSLLEKNNVPYKILRKTDFYFSSYLEDFFHNYRVMVSVWERGCMFIPETAHILKVNITYGAGKELTMVRPSRGLHDLILSYGERDKKLFSLYTTTTAIGNPKFDDFYAKSFDKDLLLSLNLDKNKKTVLYLPTHSTLSSFNIVLPKLISLASTYNIIVKLHYYQEREESDFIKNLDKKNIVLLTDDSDLGTLLFFCDIAISDNSSAIFDIIQADKPILVADFWTEDFLNIEHKIPVFYKRGMGGPITYSESIEQIIKRDKKIPTFRLEDNIQEKIEDTLTQDAVFSEHRKELRRELFAYQDENCGKRGSVEILNLVEGALISKKGIMFHLFEASKNFNSSAYRPIPYLIKENNIYKTILGQSKLLAVNIVIFDSSLEMTLMTLRSIPEINCNSSVVVVSESNSEYLKQKHLDIKFIKNISEYSSVLKKENLEGTIFIDSGVIFNQLDFSSLLFFIKNNPELEIVNLFPKYANPLSNIKKISLDIAERSVYGSFNREKTDALVCKVKYMHFDSMAFFICKSDIAELYYSEIGAKKISSIVSFINRKAYRKVAFLSSFFKDIRFFDDSQKSVYEVSFRLFQTELSIPFKDRYSLSSFLIDGFLDIFTKKMSLFFTRLKFIAYLLYFRCSFLLYDLKKSQSKK